MVEIERYRFYRATVRIRRGDGWDVKPEAEALDGQRVHVEAMYGLDAEDCGGKYDGELAMWFVGADRGRWPIAWIASGDLVDVEEAERPAELGSPPLPYPVNWTA